MENEDEEGVDLREVKLTDIWPPRLAIIGAVMAWLLTAFCVFGWWIEGWLRDAASPNLMTLVAAFPLIWISVGATLAARASVRAKRLAAIKAENDRTEAAERGRAE